MDVNIIFKAGGSFVTLPPAFSANSENVYVAWKNYILAYNTKTGSLLSKFSGITDTIVGFGVHHYNSYECITACSSSGELITWKASTHFKLFNKKLDVNNIQTFHLIPTDASKIKAIVSHVSDNKVRFSLNNIVEDSSRRYKLKLRKGLFFVGICSQKYFAVAQMQTIYFIAMDDFTKISSQLIDKTKYFTCLSCHPEEELVLTGDSLGRVLVWQNLFGSKPTQSVFHWHTLPVKCVGFSMAGSYFYSGGKECVLVRWELNNHLQKNFLPRLPDAIYKVTVSPDNLYIAIATKDNAIRIVDSRFDKVSLIQHLVIGDQFESGIILDPRTKALIMNGNTGHVQFYSTSDSNLLYNVDIVGQNKITSERGCNIQNTEITKVAISKSGLWMATVEERQDVECSPEIRLKFWNFDLKNQKYKLVTSIEYPHKTKVHSMMFQPVNNEASLICVTVGDDRQFKLWQLVEVDSVSGLKSTWRLLNATNYRDLQCKALSFSMDGSLVAVSFEEIITTWSPEIGELKYSLVHPKYKQTVNHLQFGRNNQCHLLVAAYTEALTVWNLLTLSIIWTVPLKTKFLIADSITTYMAVFTPDEQLYVFSPESEDLVFSSHTLLQNHDVCAASFVPNKYCNDVRLKWYQRSSIYFIDSNRELYSLGEEEEASDIVVESNDTINSLIPKSTTSIVKDLVPVEHTFARESQFNSIKKYLEAPTHTSVPIRYLCGSLLKSMILRDSVTN